MVIRILTATQCFLVALAIDWKMGLKQSSNASKSHLMWFFIDMFYISLILKIIWVFEAQMA